MRTSIILIPFLLVFISCGEELGDYVEPTNLIEGFSFESDDLSAWWNYHDPDDDFTLERTQSDAFDGSSSLSITSASSSNNNFAFWQTQILSVDPGKTYKVTVRIKGENLDENSIVVNMFGRKAEDYSNTVSGLSGPLSPTSEWQEYTVQLDTPADEDTDLIDVYLLFTANKSGTVYFDKVELLY